MSAILEAFQTVEFWFGIAAGVAVDEAARGALRSALFDRGGKSDEDVEQSG